MKASAPALASALALCAVATMTTATARAQEVAPVPAAPQVTLAEAIRRAEARSPTTALARQEVARAGAIVEEVRAGWLPTVTATGTYTRLDSNRVGTGGVVIAGENQLNLSLGVNVPIVAPQRWAQWSHAQDAEDTVRAADREARWQVATAVTRAYLGVLAQHRLVESLGTAVDTARAHVGFAHERFAGGVGNRVDEVRAAQDLAAATAQLSSAVGTLVRAREQLGVLVGGDGPLDVATAAPALPDAPRDVLGHVEERPDLATARSRIAAAERVVRDDWIDYLPTLVGTFQPFYQEPPTLTLPQTGWQATVALVVPLYDGGYRYGAAREREAQLAEARIEEQAITRQARADVRAALESVRRSDEALASARQAHRLATETLELTTTAYRAGTTTSLEVIDAQRRERDAEVAEIVAEDAARQARVDLLVASGSSLDARRR